MAKPNSNKVPSQFGEALIKTGKDLNALYSKAIILSYNSTGWFAPGFDAKDLVAWVRENHPDLYDEKGKRIK